MKKVTLIVALLAMLPIFNTAHAAIDTSPATAEELAQIKQEADSRRIPVPLGSEEAEAIAQRMRDKAYEIFTADDVLPYYLPWWRASKMQPAPNAWLSLAYDLLEREAQGLGTDDLMTTEWVKETVKLEDFQTYKAAYKLWREKGKLTFIQRVRSDIKPLQDELAGLLLQQKQQNF
jgi:hypothetical protein